MDPTTHTALMYFTLALGFLTAVGTSVSLFLHWLAPRTQSPWDDHVVAKLDQLLVFLRGLALPTSASPSAALATAPVTHTVATSPQTPSAKAAQAGRVGTMLIAALAALGIVSAAALLTGCATLRSSTAGGLEAFIDCEDPALAKVAADL